jgi:hypothetical protein
VSTAPRRRGRPFLGAVFGFLTFLFLAADLVLFGIIPTYSPVITALPIVGLVVGIAWAFWAPLGRRPAAAPPVEPPPA